MKNNLIVLSIFLLVTVGAFAQKDQIKEAQSLYDKGKNEEALAVLKKNRIFDHKCIRFR
ncbi:hypothetical protein AAFH68_45450 [Flavobacterium sp. CGRL1]